MSNGAEDAYITNGGKCRVGYSISSFDTTYQNTHQRSLEAQKSANFKQGDIRMEQDRRHAKKEQSICRYQQEASQEER